MSANKPFILVTLLLIPIAQANVHHKRNPKAVTFFKYYNPCPSTGLSYGKCPGYIVDHIIPLACGGADHRSNMQWQTTEAAKLKDKNERLPCTK